MRAKLLLDVWGGKFWVLHGTNGLSEPLAIISDSEWIQLDDDRHEQERIFEDNKIRAALQVRGKRP
jgi:hypothetical protein